MSDLAARVRHQQRVEDLCAAAIRALCEVPDLRYRAGTPYRGESPVLVGAPHLAPRIDEDDFGSFRGAADGVTLRIMHSDPVLHATLMSGERLPGLLFELLEQLRVESLTDPRRPGVVANLRHRHVDWSLSFHASGLTETAHGLLIYTVAQVCRSQVTAEPVVTETEDLIEASRFALAPLIGAELAELRRTRSDQAAYAAPARRIAEKVVGLIGEVDLEAGDARARTGSSRGFTLFPEVGPAISARTATADSGDSAVLSAADNRYQVFTTAYDRQQRIGELVRPAQLGTYRAVLDELIEARGINVHTLARQLRALFDVPRDDGWDAGQESGLVDGRSLTGLITSPANRRIFRAPRVGPVADTLVTVLLDCSGSMRRYQRDLAMMVDVLARSLDLAGVSNEILGFTTRAWNGGRAMRDWVRAGRPRHPGRLNERHHLVVKSADDSWRRARPAIAGLLRDDLYREALDGEAVAWACARMQDRPESRRVLLVISDGSPMDSATNLVNDSHYLDAHLRDVVMTQESTGSVLILGLGVGLDLSPYYPRSRVLDLDAGLDRGTLREVVALLATGLASSRR